MSAAAWGQSPRNAIGLRDYDGVVTPGLQGVYWAGGILPTGHPHQRQAHRQHQRQVRGPRKRRRRGVVDERRHRRAGEPRAVGAGGLAWSAQIAAGGFAVPGVEYYLTAVDASPQSNAATHPMGAPAATHRFTVTATDDAGPQIQVDAVTANERR